MGFDWSILAVALPFVFVAGFVDSIAGGGGVISITGFLLSGLPVYNVYGVNKVQAMTGTAVSAFNYIKNGYFNKKFIPFALAGAIIGAFSGSTMVTILGENVLKMTLIAILPAIAVIIMFNKQITSLVKPHKLTTKTIFALSTFIGLTVGFYDGFIGPGTGTFFIIAFTMCGMTMLEACGSAKIINLATNVISTIIFLKSGFVIWWLAIPCIITNMAANQIGSRLAIKNGEKIIRPVLLVVMGLLAIYFIYDIIK